MTTNSPGPTWYDILGVDPTAGPAEIKAAWRNATDKFEPGTGASQFRLFNEAADVLLDPAKRAAYDAGLGIDEDPDAPVPDLAETPEAAVTEPEPEESPVVELAETPEAALADPEPGDDPAPGRNYLLPVAVLVVLAIASVVVAAILAVKVHHRVAEANAARDASAVATRALTAVLSYNYLHMDADRNRSVLFLTPAYRKEYVKTFSLLTDGPNGTPGGAEKTKAVVTADVLSSGIVDANSNTVRVLVFVNQTSVKGSSAPAIFQNRVVATMVRSGDSWLVSDITSY
ncbi:MAG: dnaJ 1 [Marmoricola sp.]|nr:dnaJ 1 [Marmoricola sp.]